MMKKVILYSLLPIFLLASTLPDEGLDALLQKITNYHALRPQEKLYLHFDKPLYVAGEDVWFKSYLVNASFHKADTINTVVYVELFNPEKKLLKRLVLPSSRGYSHGDFHLGDTLKQGNYTIRAYTNYMKNQDEDFFFLKEISILNPAVVKEKVSPRPASLDVQFFPEGGNLIPDVENRIGFKALNSSGRSEDVQGDIVDDTGNTIVSFKTDHAGMGMIRLTPKSNKKYKARITTREGAESQFNLPATQDGFLMRVTTDNKNIRVITYTNVKSASGADKPVYLVAQVRGTICYVAKGKLTDNTFVAAIPKKAFPSGIVQITLFDASLVPQCERLVFINKQDNLIVNIKPDKYSLPKRANTEIEITAFKKDGTPAAGNFSLSVYDAGKMPKQPYDVSIGNYLLLSSDLKGNIEEPGYYLKDTLKDTRDHLDLLMMTHGWRRFTWKKITEEPLKPLNYHVENGIVLTGSVERSLVKKPASGSELKIITSAGDIVLVKSDSLGNFYADGFLYYDSARIVIQTDNEKGKQKDLFLKVNPFNPSPVLMRTPSATPFVEALDLVQQVAESRRIASLYKMDKDAILLQEVKVASTRDEFAPIKIYGMADNTFKVTNMEMSYPNILMAMKGRIAGVNIGQGSVSIRGSAGAGFGATSGLPLFVLDGIPLSEDGGLSIIQSIPTSDIDYVDVLKTAANTSAYGSRGANGVILVYTKRGGGIPPKPTLGIHNFSYPGFAKAREFYSPNYNTPPQNASIPDIRTTLYWNPSIQLDDQGKAKVSFFTSDVLSDYEIVVEGISADGYPGIGKAGIRVSEQ